MGGSKAHLLLLFGFNGRLDDGAKKKLSDTKVIVQLKEPAFGVAPGQFGVIYNGTKVVCGGRISPKVLENIG